MNTNDYKAIRDILLNAKNIVLSTHTNPDGDTLGSALGLYYFLKSKGIEVQMITPDVAPDFLSWMQGYKEFVIFSNEQKAVETIIAEAEVIVHVDYNAFHRTGGDLAKLFESQTTAQHLIIDHHPNPADVFTAYISDTSACSTAQLIFQLTQFISPHELLSKEAAICLYVGLITDTGSFSYAMADEKPYLIAADLVKAGIDDKWIHQKVYSNNTLDRLKLLGYALSEKLVIDKGGKWAYISLTKQELAKYNYKAGDNEGLVNYALSINGVVAAVMLTEKEGKIRLSFRSKGNFAINQIAQQHFEGGGHLNAAGGNSIVPMNATIDKLKLCMSAYNDELDKQ